MKLDPFHSFSFFLAIIGFQRCFQERDDISLVSTVSSVGDDDTYLSEPTYNNLDPVWAQRHGFGPGITCLCVLPTARYKFFGCQWGKGTRLLSDHDRDHCCGSGMLIPDPCFIPFLIPAIRIKEFKQF
jgi:hypothetical protein